MAPSLGHVGAGFLSVEDSETIALVYETYVILCTCETESLQNKTSVKC
jgi:hypothetical protein